MNPSKLLLHIALLLIIPFTSSIAQQKPAATLRGTVTTSDGQPAAGVTLRLKDKNNGAATGENGEYRIAISEEGTYTVIASAVGRQTVEKTIRIDGPGTFRLDFVLSGNAEQLKEVVVLSGRDVNKIDRFAAKMPLTNLENPQIYNTVSSEVMKQQAIVNFDDAMRNVPGIVRTWESTGRGGDGASYFALRGFDAQPVLYNGLPGLTSGNLDPAGVEEIQVLKGPSGTLFGGSFYSYGGIINTITKKPYFTTGGEVAYQAGSFGLNRVTLDFNTPLGEQEKVAMRVNAAYHTENSFQDAGFKESFYVAPSLVYQVNDRLSLHLNAEILQEERALASIFFHSDRVSPLDFKNIAELNLNNELSFTSDELTIKNPRYNLQALAVYQLSSEWTSQTVVSQGRVRSDGIYSYIWDDDPGNEWFSQYFHNEDQVTNTLDIQQNFNGDFNIGGMRNRVVVGLEYFNRQVTDQGSGWAVGRKVTPWGDVAPPADTLETVPMTAASIDELLAGTGTTNSDIANSSYSAYFSNVLNVTPQLMAMVSLRADYFDSRGEKSAEDDDYDQFALSPKFGLVYQPVPDKVSLFANYMNAFINVAPRQVFDEEGNYLSTRSFKPEHANQLEFGVKAGLFSDRLFGTLSVYNIRVSDRVYPDPANTFNSVQGGTVRSQGFEIDIQAHPVEGLNLLAGYSYNDIETVDGNNTDFYSEPGRSPGARGRRISLISGLPIPSPAARSGISA
ncbi:TonB-dependent receptor [Anseongella ginsenosidimutans]|uniref:TonB-dependent receptor n=1 Tax=Anseongella ginsenosidimutans TaxID=496056 RepID=UPI001CEF680F|nr:TonB-dependent receptor [Anseongella ginsenosidimutans]